MMQSFALIMMTVASRLSGNVLADFCLLLCISFVFCWRFFQVGSHKLSDLQFRGLRGLAGSHTASTQIRSQFEEIFFSSYDLLGKKCLLQLFISVFLHFNGTLMEFNHRFWVPLGTSGSLNQVSMQLHEENKNQPKSHEINLCHSSVTIVWIRKHIQSFCSFVGEHFCQKNSLKNIFLRRKL